MANIDLYNIDNARIHELRDFARKVGVISPTTMKKEDIIKNILGIANGKIEPFKNPPKHGRPARNHSSRDVNSSSLFVALDDMSDEKYDIPSESYFNYELHSSDKHFEYGTTMSSGIREGYLDINPKGYGCIRNSGYTPSSEDVFVSIDIIKSKGLKSGDYVKGYVSRDDITKPYIMFEVSSVNNDIEPRFDFDNAPFEMYSRCITFGNKNIYAGSRCYFKNNFNEVVNCVKTLESGSVKLLNLKALPEQVVQNTKSLEYVPVYFNKSENDVISTTTLLVNRCKRLVEMGQDVTLVIYNFSEILKAYNVALTGKYDISYFNYQAITKVKDILFSAKNIDTNHSLTIIAIDRDNVNENILSVINNEFSDIFSSVK